MTQQSGAGSPQQFCLRWNNYQTNLTNVFDQLLQSESFVDVTLACDGHSVKAHKMVLSACSPYFQALFFDNPCHHPIVIMKDIKWPELKAAVEFMYKGEINVSQEQIGPLLKVAECLKIRGLADVNSEHELTARGLGLNPENLIAGTSSGIVPGSSSSSSSSSLLHSRKKRRRVSGERNSPLVTASPEQNSCVINNEDHDNPMSLMMPEIHGLGGATSSSTPRSLGSPNAPSISVTPQINLHELGMPLVLPLPPPSHNSHGHHGLGHNHHHHHQHHHVPGGGGGGGGSGHVSSAGHAAINHLAAHVQQQQQHQQHQEQQRQEHERREQQRHREAQQLSVQQAQQQAQHQHSHQQHHLQQQLGNPLGIIDDLEIKPGIAEMIREEERAKMLESSHAWLGASTSNISADYSTLLKLKAPTWTRHDLQEAIEAVVTQKMRFTQASTKYGIPKGTLYDNILGKSKRMMVLEEAGLNAHEETAVLQFCCDITVSPYNRHSYQYQLQSLWQKCWNTNSGLVHNLRFRERGPLKSWRPETMAEAIFSVLKEGLSLSQAARKYDIPYPTFVLYANRVHNMLGPSSDGGADLRPKGRGRPQRILLGVWPDEHIRGVIRAVVFRDGNVVKDEQTPIYPSLANYACNGPEGAVSPGAAAAAAVAAVAQGLRHQMCSMVAAAQSHQHDMIATNLSANFQAAVQVSQHHLNNTSPVNNNNNNNNNSNNRNSPLLLGLPSPGSGGPPESPMEGSPLASPLAPLMDPAHIPSSVELGIGVSGMTYKPNLSYVSPRPENLFQDEIADLVKSSHAHKDKDKVPVKLEPLSDSRSEQ